MTTYAYNIRLNEREASAIENALKWYVKLCETGAPDNLKAHHSPNPTPIHDVLDRLRHNYEMTSTSSWCWPDREPQFDATDCQIGQAENPIRPIDDEILNNNSKRQAMIEAIAIRSADYWVKIVEMLQQNWALVDIQADGAAHVFFISDHSGVFDEMVFPSADAARHALENNGFERFSTNVNLQSFLRQPSAPFHRSAHPNGPIYSSGRFWKL